MTRSTRSTAPAAAAGSTTNSERAEPAPDPMTVSSSAEGEPAWTRAIELETPARLGPRHGQARGEAAGAVSPRGRGACVQQPLPARRLSPGRRRARRRELGPHLPLAQLEVRPADQHQPLRRRQPAHLSGEGRRRRRGLGRCPRRPGRGAGAAGARPSSTTRWPTTMRRASPASLPVSIGPVPSPKWRLRVPSGAATSACATA